MTQSIKQTNAFRSYGYFVCTGYKAEADRQGPETDGHRNQGRASRQAGVIVTPPLPTPASTAKFIIDFLLPTKVASEHIQHPSIFYSFPVARPFRVCLGLPMALRIASKQNAMILFCERCCHIFALCPPHPLYHFSVCNPY